MSKAADAPSKAQHDVPDSERGAQQAALHEGGDSKRARKAKNTVFDGDEHSDAPGPFGTG